MNCFADGIDMVIHTRTETGQLVMPYGKVLMEHNHHHATDCPSTAVEEH